MTENIPHVLGHPATAEWCAAVDAHHSATEAINAKLREAVTEARDTFNRYADLHKAKHTQEALAKAMFKRDLAKKMQSALT
jgi:hypothetical protein